MTDGFHVDPIVLGGHADEVDALAQRMRTTAEAATPVTADAYGVIGQVFALGAAGASRSAAQAVADLATTTQALSATLRACCDEYLLVEQQAAEAFGATER